jgi:hypothetical protein
MFLHRSRRPFENWGPPTRFATARDAAIFALCLLLVVGFLASFLRAPPATLAPLTRTATSERGAPT